MTLFQTGKFRLHSDQPSSWLIDCDALTGEDMQTLAALIAETVSFSRVLGIPRGGIRLAAALEQYQRPGTDYPVLIVDDVLTTGRSMRDAREDYPGAIGYVIFARGECPSWVQAIFRSDLP